MKQVVNEFTGLMVELVGTSLYIVLLFFIAMLLMR